MNQQTSLTITKQSQLHQQITLLANLRPAARVMVSCYLDLNMKSEQLENFIREKVTCQLSHRPDNCFAGLEEGVRLISTQLYAAKSAQARGLAVFCTIDSNATLLSSMPFAAPLRNRISVAASPDLLPLIQLRELYGRFMILLAKPDGMHIVEVNLGAIAVKAWVPAAYSSAVNGNYRLFENERPTAGDDLKKQVSIVERLLNKGGYCPFFLAGDADVMHSVRQLLSGSSIARLRTSIPVEDDCNMQRTAALCLRSLLESRANQARATSTRILHGVRHNRQAVTGVAASLHNLRRGIVDTLVLVDDYVQEPGWSCWNCGESLIQQTSPSRQCPHCSADGLIDLRSELMGLAGQHRIPVEFTDSDGLRPLGGVGCLLHKLVTEFVQPYPVNDNRLDLVA